MMMVVVMAADRLSQILDVGELAALRGLGKVRRKLVKLACGCRIAIGLGSLSGTLQVRGDLLRDLLVLGGVRLLKLLERAQQLGQRRELGAVRLLPDRRYSGVAGLVGCPNSALKGVAENRF